MILYLDTETYSECNLKTAGAHRYARDPSTEVTVLQWALDDGDVHVEDLTQQAAPSPEFLALFADPAVELVAHNVSFDRGLLAHALGLPTPIERWRCTQAQALAHSLPASLETLGSALGLPAGQQKDSRGKALINLFCKPRPKKSSGPPRATRATHPTEWSEFLEYSHQDVVTLREIARRLPKWNFTGRELALWRLDQTINDRGFYADVELAEAASAAAERAQTRLREQAKDKTNGAVESTTQRDVLLEYLLAEHGVALPNMQKDTLQRRLDDPELPSEVKELLRIRLEASATSASKFSALLRSVCADARLRGGLQFAGAGRTGRWCLAADTQVLVMTPAHVTMYVAIGAVRPSDLVFDGEQWVKHDGVVYSGMRETITHDGLTATPLHNVWLSNNERVMFGEAKANGWPLWRGAGIPTTGES